MDRTSKSRGTNCAGRIARGAGPRMEDLDVTETLSLVEAGCVSRQAGVDVPVAGAPVCFGAHARRRTVLWLILCVMFGSLIIPERATADGPERATAAGPERAVAYGPQSSGARVTARFTNSLGFREGWAEDFPLRNAMFPGGGSGVIESAGVALFVCGLSRYLPRDSPQEPALPDQCASVREPHECEGAGEQRQLPLHLEFLGWLFLCGFVSWGGALWMERR
jgi:hypothetical protein